MPNRSPLRPTSPSAATGATIDRTSANAAPSPEPAWIEAADGTDRRQSHPVKAKLSERIFHLPGMMNYDRTKPDRCYRTRSRRRGRRPPAGQALTTVAQSGC